MENSVIHYSGLWSSPWPKAVAAFNEKSTTIQKKIEKLTTQVGIFRRFSQAIGSMVYLRLPLKNQPNVGKYTIVPWILFCACQKMGLRRFKKFIIFGRRRKDNMITHQA